MSWSAKKQLIVARSSVEAEYHAMASATAKLTWLSFLHWDIGVPLVEPLHLFCHNLSTLHLTINHIFHAHTKHVKLDYDFVREKAAQGALVT